MENSLHNEFCRLEELYLNVKLKRAYDKVRDEIAQDSTSLMLSQQINLSKLYSNLLTDMEKTVKEAFANDGIRWTADAWNEVSVKLKRPEFVYGNIMVDSIKASKTAGNKVDTVRSKDAFGNSKMILLLNLFVLIAGLFLLMVSDNGSMKVFGAILSLVSVVGMLVLLQKQKMINSNQVFASKSDNNFSHTPDTVFDSQLKKTQAKNHTILREWFKDALEYAVEAEQNELKKERQK